MIAGAVFIAPVCFHVAAEGQAEGQEYLETVRVDLLIDETTLDQALKSLATQTQSTLLYPFDEVENIEASFIHGSYTIEEALELLLKGTGFHGILTPSGAITIARITDKRVQEEELPVTRKNIVEGASAAIIGAATIGIGANAQEAPQEDATAVLSTVTVTARKVEESLQDSPVAVTALSGAELEARAALTVSDATAGAPNVVFESAGTTSGLSAAPTVFIRGLGQSDFVINADPAVGTYVDGVYVGRSIGSLGDLLDLERVEVLRGPQGTLFGRNTIGGAVNLVSKAPSMDGNEGKIIAGIGENGYLQASATGNFVLSDQAAIRLSGFMRQRDGYVDALQYDDFQLGEEDVWGVRGALRLEPTSTLTIDLAADYSERNEAPAAVVPLSLGNISIGGESIDDSGIPVASRFNQGFPVPAPPLAVPGGFATPAGDTTTCATAAARATNTDCYGNVWLGNGFQSNALYTDGEGSIFEPTNELEVYGASATIMLDTGIGQLKSITAARGFESRFFNDFDFSPYVIFHNINDPFNQDQFSQELQLTNTNAFDGKIDYVLGLYYFEEEGLQTVRLVAPLLPPAALQTTLPLFQVVDREVDNTSSAAYGQVTFHATDRLDLTGGVRYTEEDKDIFFTQMRSVPSTPETAGSSQSISEVDYMANVSYDVTDLAMVYATYSEGFRSGGFASRFPNGLVDPLPSYDPEFVTSFEIGLKSQFWNDRARVNIAAFTTDYSDLQVTAGSPLLIGAGITENLADATLQGVEIEIDLAVTPDLTLDFAAGFLKDEIDSIVGDVLTAGAANQTFPITVDNELPYTPDLNFNLGATHYLDIESGEIRTRLDWFYTGAQELNIENHPLTAQDEYHRINANVSFTPNDRPYSVTLGVRNLTDENYSTAASIAADASSISANVARPREVYGQFTYRFGE